MINNLQNREKALNLLGLATKAGKIISGTEMVIAGLEKGKVKLVVVASDLQANTLEKVTKVASKKQIKLVNEFSAEELRHAIGKTRKVLALTDQGFAKALAQKLEKECD